MTLSLWSDIAPVGGALPPPGLSSVPPRAPARSPLGQPPLTHCLSHTRGLSSGPLVPSPVTHADPTSASPVRVDPSFRRLGLRGRAGVWANRLLQRLILDPSFTLFGPNH